MQLKHKIHWSETLLYVFPHRKSHQYWINSEKLTESNGELFWNNGNPTLKFVIEYTDTLFKMRKCLLKCAQLISQKLSPYQENVSWLGGHFFSRLGDFPRWGESLPFGLVCLIASRPQLLSVYYVSCTVRCDVKFVSWKSICVKLKIWQVLKSGMVEKLVIIPKLWHLYMKLEGILLEEY